MEISFLVKRQSRQRLELSEPTLRWSALGQSAHTEACHRQSLFQLHFIRDMFGEGQRSGESWRDRIQNMRRPGARLNDEIIDQFSGACVNQLRPNAWLLASVKIRCFEPNRQAVRFTKKPCF